MRRIYTNGDASADPSRSSLAYLDIRAFRKRIDTATAHDKSHAVAEAALVDSQYRDALGAEYLQPGREPVNLPSWATTVAVVCLHNRTALPRFIATV